MRTAKTREELKQERVCEEKLLREQIESHNRCLCDPMVQADRQIASDWQLHQKTKAQDIRQSADEIRLDRRQWAR
jgi:hypothetical protein